jgi:predicted transcriptional regulator
MNTIQHIRCNVFRMTQEEFGALAGVPQSVVSRWESGRMQPRLSVLRRIRKAAIDRGLKWDDRWFFEVAA